MKITLAFTALLAAAPLTLAAVPAWGQCGGVDWTGETTCVAGYTCVYSNQWYSQCLPSASSTTATATATATATSAAKLNTIAKAIGWKYFGTATDNGELSDTSYVNILKDNTQFGQITPGNSMKWDATEKSRGVFTFSGGDTVQAFAANNSQLVRGHTAVWHSQLPSWVSSGGFNNATLTEIVTTHTTNLVSHYKGKIYAWDVVNEPFNEDGTYRTSVFYNTTGTSYIATALRAARAADPAAKLYINDYNLEYGGGKATGMLNLAKSLIAAGVPLDGIGFQGHLIVGSVPSKSSLVATLNSFTALGLDVTFTEVDIRMTLPVTDALLAQQKTDYQTVVGACKAVTRCVGVTIWDYTDKYSWIPSVFPTQGAALPWDANLVKKPAFDGIVLGITT